MIELKLEPFATILSTVNVLVAESNVKLALAPNVLLPALLKKICVLLPAIFALPVPALAEAQVNVPEPSVVRTCPFVPPVMCRFATAPNVTLAVVVKLTIPVALLTVNPLKLPTLVILG